MATQPNPFAAIANGNAAPAQAPENTPASSPTSDKTNPFAAIADGSGLGAPSTTSAKSGANPFAAIAKSNDNPFAAIANAPAQPASSDAPETSTTSGYLDEPWYRRAWDWANKPLYEFNKTHQGGFVGGLEDVADSLATPLNVGMLVATAGTGTVLDALGVAAEELPAAVKIARGLITASFTAQQAHGMVVSSSRALDALKDGDYDRAKEYSVQAAAGLAGVALAAREMNERPIVEGEKLGPLKPAGAGQLDEAGKITDFDRIMGEHDRDLAAADQQAHATTDALNKRFEAIKGGVLPADGLVRRIEEPGVERADFSKPHGIYTTSANVESPHEDLGGKTYYWQRNTNAKVLPLETSGRDDNIAIRRGAINAGAGVHALRALAGQDEFNRLKVLNTADLLSELSQRYPDVDWNRYYDKQEMLEGLGGILARERGYDGIALNDKDDPRFSEFVGLTPKSMTPVDPGNVKGQSHVSDAVLRGAIFRRMEFPDQKAIEAARDMAASSDKIDKDTVAKYDAATKLTPEQLDFMRDLRASYEHNFHLAEENGIALQHLDDYVSHVWKEPEDVPNAALFRENNKLGNLDTQVSSARQRVWLKALEGEMLGRELATDDPVGLAGWQELSIRRAIAHREALNNLKSEDVKMPDGRPVVTHSGYGKVVADDSSKALLIDPKSVRDRAIPKASLKKMSPDELQQGLDNGTIEKLPDRLTKDGGWENRYAWSGKGYRVINHPAFADWRYITQTADGPVLMKSDMRIHPDAVFKLQKRLGIDTSRLRDSVIVDAALKASSQAKGTVFAGYNPFHIIQTGLRTVMTGTNPFRMPEVDLVSDPVLRNGVVHGLRFSSRNSMLSDFADVGEEGLSGKGAWVNRILPGSEKFHDFLWRYVNTQKAQAYKSLFSRYRSAYPDWTLDQVASKAADDTNNRFGLQNWGVLGTGKTAQDVMRLSLLAPDWLTSEVRLGMSLLQPGKKILMHDVARISGYMVLAARVGNMLKSGNPHWEQPFGVVFPGNGKQPDQVLSLRTLPGDIAHWISDPRGAAETRLSPGFTRPLLELITGRDRNGKRVLPENELADYVTAVAPIPLQNVMQRRDLSMDGKEKVALGFTKLAASVYPARTEAEKLAQTYAYDHNSSGPVDNDELPKHLRDMQVMDGIRSGKLPPAAAFQIASPRVARMMIAESKLTPLQGYASHLPLSQLIDVYQLGTSKEKDQLSKLLWSKRVAYLKNNAPRFRADDPTWKKLKTVFPDLD